MNYINNNFPEKLNPATVSNFVEDALKTELKEENTIYARNNINEKKINWSRMYVLLKNIEKSPFLTTLRLLLDFMFIVIIPMGVFFCFDIKYKLLGAFILSLFLRVGMLTFERKKDDFIMADKVLIALFFIYVVPLILNVLTSS